MPLVSVWAMSMPQVKTPTLAFVAFWTVPAASRFKRQYIIEPEHLKRRLRHTFRLATEHHSADDATLAQPATHDLDHPDIVDVELCASKAIVSTHQGMRERGKEGMRKEGRTYSLGVTRHDGHDGLGHQPREQVLGAVLLGSERRTQSNLETLLGQRRLECPDTHLCRGPLGVSGRGLSQC